MTDVFNSTLELSLLLQRGDNLQNMETVLSRDSLFFLYILTGSKSFFLNYFHFVSSGCDDALKFLPIIFRCILTGRKSVNLPVFYQEVTTSKYLYKTDIPEMTQLTICMWMKWVSMDRTAKYIFSFSNASKLALYISHHCH